MLKQGEVECPSEMPGEDRWTSMELAVQNHTHKTNIPPLTYVGQENRMSAQKWSREGIVISPGWKVSLGEENTTKHEKKSWTSFSRGFSSPQPSCSNRNHRRIWSWRLKGLSLDSRFAPVDFAYGASCRCTDIIACQRLVPGWQSIFLLDENASSYRRTGEGCSPPTLYTSHTPSLQLCRCAVEDHLWKTGSVISIQGEIWEGTPCGLSRTYHEPQESQRHVGAVDKHRGGRDAGGPSATPSASAFLVSSWIKLRVAWCAVLSHKVALECGRLGHGPLLPKLGNHRSPTIIHLPGSGELG